MVRKLRHMLWSCHLSVWTAELDVTAALSHPLVFPGTLWLFLLPSAGSLSLALNWLFGRAVRLCWWDCWEAMLIPESWRCWPTLPFFYFCQHLLVTLRCRCLPFTVKLRLCERWKCLSMCTLSPAPIRHIPNLLCLCAHILPSARVWAELTRHTHTHTYNFWKPGQAFLFLWAPVAEINSRYDCYLHPQRCSPQSLASSGLLDKNVAQISSNLCVAFW